MSNDRNNSRSAQPVDESSSTDSIAAAPSFHNTGTAPALGDTPGPTAPRRPSAARNVAANWIWYLLVLASGFIVPRLVSDYLGKPLLGVWVLGWSFVFFVRWLHMGLTSSVSRYVARDRELQNWSALNQSVNTSLAILTGACVLGFGVAAGCSYLVPSLLPDDATPELIRTARWVVIWLSLTAALQLPGGVFNAVITGCERFDALNVVRVIRDGGVLLAIVLLLRDGQDLIAVALAVLVGEICGDLAKCIAALRICPQIRLRFEHVDTQAARQLLTYGSKTVAQGLARGSLYEVNHLMVLNMLGGPAMLAIYSRQTALLKHALRFMKQYAQVFIPRSSAYDAAADQAALRSLLVTTTRIGLYFSLPIVLLLCFLGDHIVTLWMGPGFIAQSVLIVIALGHLFMIPQQGAYSVLMGQNRHGRIAIIDWCGVILGIVLAWILIAVFDLGMLGAAIGLAVPIALTGGLVMPIIACSACALPVTQYLRRIGWGPLLANVPMALSFALSRVWLEGFWIAAGASVGGLITLPIYWRLVVPAEMRRRLLGKFGINHAVSANATPTAASSHR